MRMHLIIDGLWHEIDSTDPELLGRWIMEIFGRIPQITPTTSIEIRVHPSFVPDELGRWQPDWAADSRILGRSYPVKSPRDLLAALAQQLDDLEALT